MKKKVMFFFQYIEGGGAEKVAVDVLNNIDKEKYDVTVVVIFGDGLYMERLCDEIEIKSIFNRSYNKIINKLIYTFVYYFPKLFYKLFIPKNFEIEIAFLEGFATKVISYSTNKESKKIAWIHTTLQEYHWTKYAYKKNEELHCYKRFNDLIFVSQSSILSFQRLFNIDKVDKHIVYNPIITEEILKKSIEKEVVYNTFTIISVGRLIDVKGYQRLIRAHGKLVNEYPHKLIIIGDGDDRKVLENLINELGVCNTVELMGFIENPYPYVLAADLFVSASIEEGFSLAVAEAIILEKPVMITKTSGLLEVLGGEYYGLTCENSQKGIEEELLYILQNKEVLEVYKGRSKERRNFFKGKKIIKDIEEILG